MFILKEDMLVAEMEHLRDGKGSVIAQKIVTPDMLCGAGTMFNRMTLMPGCSVGVHDHVTNFEIYYILEGEAKVTDGAEEKILKAGDVEICSHGNTHSIENVSDKPAVFLAAIFNNFEDK